MACKRNSNLGFWMLFFLMVSKKQCKEKVSHESNASHIPNIPQDIFLSPMDQKKQKTSHYYELGCNSTLPRMESWKMKGFVQASGSLQNMTKILVAIACWVSKFASQPYTPNSPKKTWNHGLNLYGRVSNFFWLKVIFGRYLGLGLKISGR